MTIHDTFRSLYTTRSVDKRLAVELQRGGMLNAGHENCSLRSSLKKNARALCKYITDSTLSAIASRGEKNASRADARCTQSVTFCARCTDNLERKFKKRTSIVGRRIFSRIGYIYIYVYIYIYRRLVRRKVLLAELDED